MRKNDLGYGAVFSNKDICSMIMVNLGAAYPNELLTLAIQNLDLNRRCCAV